MIEIFVRVAIVTGFVEVDEQSTLLLFRDFEHSLEITEIAKYIDIPLLVMRTTWTKNSNDGKI
ncbi:hypothetical protein H8K32_05480 [Undibacterium jejuense]|uniref:Uncharacterized protein n=1 Tax=Undibacterium jejuense TaxID=1344949 RepID=A0A923HKX9_9BURK|nr:hypothetical protein [Undibacterium jejuense]